MVTILPKEEPWYIEPAQKLATSIGEGYKTRHDTMALQNAISGLGPNASPRDILAAVAPVQTYNPNAKKQFTEDWFKAAQLEENFASARSKAAEDRKAKEVSRGNAINLINSSDLPDDKKKELTNKVQAGEIDFAGAKALTKPEAKKRESEEAISPEQMSRIKKARSHPDYENASSFKKYQMLLDEGVSRTNAKAESDIYAEQEKIETQKAAEKRKEELTFHKESEEYDAELRKAAKGAQNQLDASNDVREAIEKGGSNPWSLANIFKQFGEVGQALSDAILSGEQATIQASVPAFLEGRKELFGVRLSDADLKLLKDKLPDMGKSKEANIAILNMMNKYSKLSVLRNDIGRQIKEENGGIRPIGYADKVDKRFDEMTKPVKIRNPKTGKVVDIPAYQVSQAVKNGGELVK